MRTNTQKDNMLRCPYCDTPIEEPQDITTRFGNTVSGGKCECGAVYVYDRSGHNLGDAYVDVLNLAFDGDMERAWALTPGEDYEIKELTYNSRRNKLGREFTSRGKLSPAYIFVRVKKEG